VRLSRPRGLPGLLFRLLLYIAAITILLVKIAPNSKNLLRLPAFAPADSTLTVAGADLAPELIRAAVEQHRIDYPNLTIHLQGGGTAGALEALANGGADAAFLNRPPTAREQALIREARRDTVLWAPVAVGGLVFVRAAGPPVDSLSVEGLRRFLTGEPDTRFRTLYAPDPNQGLWDALSERLGLSGSELPKPAGVVFLADETTVLETIRTGGSDIGLVGSLNLPGDLGGLVTIPVAGDSGRAGPPTDEAIATGRYPLFHHLYVACLDRGGLTGSMFVTSITSDRGQRRIERAGYLPARRVLREILLSTNPVGKAG
jgi:ABC-type phosphate transport system substrate-binding protein